MLRKVPDEIEELRKIYMPYLVGCHLENAPKEAIEALKKEQKWALEQGQSL